MLRPTVVRSAVHVIVAPKSEKKVRGQMQFLMATMPLKNFQKTEDIKPQIQEIL